MTGGAGPPSWVFSWRREDVLDWGIPVIILSAVEHSGKGRNISLITHMHNLPMFYRKCCPLDTKDTLSGGLLSSTVLVAMIATFFVLFFITLSCCVCSLRREHYSSNKYLNQPQLQTIRVDPRYPQDHPLHHSQTVIQSKIPKLGDDPPPYPSLHKKIVGNI